MRAEQVLAVMIIDRRAQPRLRGREPASALGCVLGHAFVPMRFLGPDAAPILPEIDPRDEPVEVVEIDARRSIARIEMREDEVYLRIAGHASIPFMCSRISVLAWPGAREPQHNKRHR